MNPRYNIGDTVWYAEAVWKQHDEICPDCGGKLFLTVILAGGEQVSIDCETCKPRGVTQRPEGIIHRREWKVVLKSGVVRGMEILPDKIEYKLDMRGSGGCYSCTPKYEEEISATAEEAKPLVATKDKELKEQEADKIRRKEKPNRTWAQNVSWYRTQIRRAEKDIEFYKAKLNAAPAKTQQEGE
jgi:hypothetical protein